MKYCEKLGIWLLQNKNHAALLCMTHYICTSIIRFWTTVSDCATCHLLFCSTWIRKVTTSRISAQTSEASRILQTISLISLFLPDIPDCIYCLSGNITVTKNMMNKITVSRRLFKHKFQSSCSQSHKFSVEEAFTAHILSSFYTSVTAGAISNYYSWRSDY